MGINCKAHKTRAKRTCRVYIVCFCLFAHDGSGGAAHGIMEYVATLWEGAPPLHFYLGGIVFFVLVGLLTKIRA